MEFTRASASKVSIIAALMLSGRAGTLQARKIATKALERKQQPEGLSAAVVAVSDWQRIVLMCALPADAFAFGEFRISH